MNARRNKPAAEPRRRSGAAPKQHRHRDTAPTQRQLRVAEEIRHVLASLFTRHEFHDPVLAEADITVSEVRIGPDLKHATAFVSRLGRTDIEALLPALRRATPWVRGQLARDLTLRAIPDLSFQADHALDYAMKIESLMRQPEVVRDLRDED